MLYRSTFHQSATLWHLHKHKPLASYPKAESPPWHQKPCLLQCSYDGPVFKGLFQHTLPPCRLDLSGMYHHIDMFLHNAGILLEQMLGLPVQAVGMAIRHTPAKRAKVRVVPRKAHVEDWQNLHALTRQVRASGIHGQ